MDNKIIELKEIGKNYAEELTKLLSSEDEDYSRYFIPFAFDLQTIEKIFRQKKKDRIFGVFIDTTLAGFYMLRGFDDGFEIPSYGVWISKKYSNKGLSKLTLQHAISFCKINGIKKLMLKVHPDNKIAKKIYENYGFINEGIDPKNDNLIYYKEF